MKFIFITIGLLLCVSSCVSVKFHDYAETDYAKAVDHINALKQDTLVVVLPTYHREKDLLRSAMIKMPGKRASLKRKYDEYIATTIEENLLIQEAFAEHFTFCPYMLMPDTLVQAFEEGNQGDFFVDKNLEFDPQMTLSNRRPVKLISRGLRDWDLRVGKELVPNPFPNNIGLRSGFRALLNLDSAESLTKMAAQILNRRLNKFHKNPTQKVRY